MYLTRDKEHSGSADTLGGRIVHARELQDLTTAQLARRVGVKTATLHEWETDRSEPRSSSAGDAEEEKEEEDVETQEQSEGDGLVRGNGPAGKIGVGEQCEEKRGQGHPLPSARAGQR